VYSWLSAPCVIIIHAGKVVVHQRIGVDELYGRPHMNDVFRDRMPEGLCCGKSKQRSNTFATSAQGVE
jgi:hypothetical protein